MLLLLTKALTIAIIIGIFRLAVQNNYYLKMGYANTSQTGLEDYHPTHGGARSRRLDTFQPHG